MVLSNLIHRSLSCLLGRIYSKDVSDVMTFPLLSGVRLYDDGPDIKLLMLVGWDRSSLSVAWPTGVQLVFFVCSGLQLVIRRPGISIVGQLTESVESPFLIHQGDYHDLFVCP